MANPVSGQVTLGLTCLVEPKLVLAHDHFYYVAEIASSKEEAIL